MVDTIQSLNLFWSSIGGSMVKSHAFNLSI